MAIPKRLIEAGLAQPTQHYIFEKSLFWPGVKVAHNLLHPGETVNRWQDKHHIVIPLAGSFEASMTMIGGHRSSARRTTGHTSVIPAGHQYSANWTEELEDVAIFLDPAFIKRQAGNLVQTDRLDIISACESRDPLIHQIGLSLAAEIDTGASSGSIYAESLVNTLVAHLIRHYSTASDRFQTRFGGLPKHKLRRVIEFIDANLESDLTLAELAEVAELSPFHFARSFKQTTGSTPIQFLMQRRIERAGRLLAETDLPIVEIGLLVGFKNQSHFTTLFRKITAMTPKAYRNEHLR